MRSTDSASYSSSGMTVRIASTTAGDEQPGRLDDGRPDAVRREVRVGDDELVAVPEPIERGEQVADEDRMDAAQHLGPLFLEMDGMSVLLIRCLTRFRVGNRAISVHFTFIGLTSSSR